MYKIGLIGTGNMGSALARAAAKAVKPEEILLANRTKAKAEALAEELGCRAGTNEEAAKNCKYLFLGVKPGMMADMLAPLKPVLAARDDRFILVTMAAGLSIADIRQMAGGPYPTVRIMPNTAVAVGQGMTVGCASPEVSEEERREFSLLLSASGRFEYLAEDLIDAAGALSGCGPAYVYLFLEALCDGAVECGLPRAQATHLAAQTLIGAATLLLESGSHPGALKDAVCSPGGSTIAGVHALEAGGFRGTVMDAVTAGYEKTLAMKQPSVSRDE